MNLPEKGKLSTVNTSMKITSSTPNTQISKMIKENKNIKDKKKSNYKVPNMRVNSKPLRSQYTRSQQVFDGRKVTNFIEITDFVSETVDETMVVNDKPSKLVYGHVAPSIFVSTSKENKSEFKDLTEGLALAQAAAKNKRTLYKERVKKVKSRYATVPSYLEAQESVSENDDTKPVLYMYGYGLQKANQSGEALIIQTLSDIIVVAKELALRGV